MLRTYVSRLRGGPLGPPEHSPLVTGHHGYELRVAVDGVDADRFEALVAAGRAAFDGGEAPGAEALLREALELVRGTPLAELADDRVAGLERDRLDELRAVAAEELVEARLAQGRHRELVAELQAAVAADRLRERTCGQLMVALYRSGPPGRGARRLPRDAPGARGRARPGARPAAARDRADDPAPGPGARPAGVARADAAALRDELPRP